MTHYTHKEWKDFNPYFAGSQRSHEAARLSQAKDDILELFAEIERLRALSTAGEPKRDKSHLPFWGTSEP